MTLMFLAGNTECTNRNCAFLTVTFTYFCWMFMTFRNIPPIFYFTTLWSLDWSEGCFPSHSLHRCMLQMTQCKRGTWVSQRWHHATSWRQYTGSMDIRILQNFIKDWNFKNNFLFQYILLHFFILLFLLPCYMYQNHRLILHHQQKINQVRGFLWKM